MLFSAEAWPIVYQAQIINVQPNSVTLSNKVPYTHIADVMQRKRFGLQCKMTRFSSRRVDSDGENMVFVFSELEEIEETRQSERFPFEHEEKVICEIRNPVDQKTILSREILDMSATGLSLRCAKPSALFRPGRYFPELRVIINGQIYQNTSGTVVYTRQMMDLNAKLRVQVGMKFETKI